MGIVYWKDDSEFVCVARNMQAVALDQGLWDAYLTCQDKGRAVFKECLADEFYDWSLGTVLTWAESVDNPTDGAVTGGEPTPTTGGTTGSRAPTTQTPRVSVPTRSREAGTKYAAFYNWMVEQTGLVGQHSQFSYVYGGRRVLSDGTVAVSVSIARNGKVINHTDFVFHYHPGVKGATVGHGSASKWHFKPFDGAKKYVRMEDSQFSKLNEGMVKQVKSIAQNK